MGDHDRDGEGSPSEDRSSHEHGGEHDREHHEAGDEGRIEQSVLEDEAEDAGAAHRTGDARREPGGGHGHRDHGGMHAGHERMFRRRFFVSTLLSVPVIYFSDFVQRTFGYTAPTVPGVEWVVPAFAAIVFLYGGVPFLRMAVPELRDRSPGMMTLISMAIAVAFVYSLATVLVDRGEPFFWELVTLIDVMLLGHWIEMRSVRRASSALDELAKLMPDTAERITESGDTEEVSVSELSEGDLVLVRPGASVPADGVVEEGDSDVNEAMITGESKPVSKEPGDEVIGGTVNGDGSLRVRVDAIGEDTTLAGIMRLVEEARSSKSKTQVLADRAAGWLFYAALAAAAVTAVAWTVATTFGADVVARTVTVLVIACPHALGLAIPLVVAINTSVAARNGMLVRDRIAMEDARTLDVIVFDKTGTLTEGEHGVVGQATVDGVDEDEALALAAAVEADSEHVIARAIGEAADDRGVDVPDTADFEAIKGRGVRAFVDVSGESGGSPDASDGGQEVYVGGPNLLNRLESDVPSELQSFTEQAGANARTVVYLVREGELLAAFALADVIREESYRVVDALHDLDIEVAMLTGDSRDVADAVADELGIDTVFAEVLPEDKDEKVQELQDRGKLVGMVGDGVNDAPALTRADVGIAIGSGTDVAVQSADVVLVQNDPMDVVRLVKLSRASYRKMQENIVWAAGYNVFAIPAAAGVLAPVGVLLSPAVGALLMSLSTVIVAINAQLLRRVDLSVPGLPDVSPATDARPAD